MKRKYIHIINAFILFLLFSFVFFNTGAHLVILLFTALYYLPVIFASFRNRALLKKRISQMCIYLCTVLLIFLTSYGNSVLAEKRFNKLINAVEAFYSQNGIYPTSLSELVPNYIEKIPIAMYTLVPVKYEYTNKEWGKLLEYNPYYIGRPIFHEFK
jgi:hypothetical protein